MRYNDKFFNSFFSVLSAVLLSVFLVSEAGAQSKDPFSREVPSIMQSPAAMGMGGAYYGKSDDKYAGFYNPAGLGHYKGKWTVDLIPVTVGINERGLNSAKKIIDTLTKGDLGNQDTATQFIDTLMGGYTNLSPVNFYPAFTKKNLSVGIFSSNQINLLAYNKVLPEIAVRGKSDNGAIVSFAFQFLEDDSLSLGFSIKGLYRISFTKSYTAGELAGLFAKDGGGTDSLLKEIMKDGAGWGIYGTVGLMYDIPLLKKYIAPRVGISFNDFGYSAFGPLMEKIDPTLNLSVAFSPGWGPISTDIVFDFTDLLFMAGSDKSFGKRVNMGAEIGFWNKLFLRVGLHQGYLTAGAGFSLWNVLKMNYAYYTEELGAYSGQYKDTRHVVEFSIGF